MFKNIKISARLALSFSILIVFLIAIIITSVVTIGKVNDNLKKVAEVENIRTQLANEIIDNAREVALSVRGTLLFVYANDKGEHIERMKNNWERSWRNCYNSINGYKKLINNDDDTERINQINQITTIADSAKILTARAIEISLKENIDDATSYVFTTAYPKVRRLITLSNNLILDENKSTVSYYENSEKLYIARRTLIISIGIGAIILSVISTFILTMGITRPLNQCVHAANKISSGDLTINITVDELKKDELNVLLKSFKTMIENLRVSTVKISEATNLLASSSSEILAATTQVAAGSVETATAITETTTTVEEVRQAALLSSQKANRVLENAKKISQVTLSGQDAIGSTVNGMHDIQKQMETMANTIVRLSEQGQQIGSIIASVTDLADQSNILAVNASIEAAKAGEQGKGFAVVAQEIKSLAQQSKQATIEIRNILSDIQKSTSAAVMATEQTGKSVESGVKQSTQAGEAIERIAEGSTRSMEAATQIVASSQQQSTGMDQIVSAMNNINQASTQNAASMKQAEQSAKDLNELGLKLKTLIEQYKLN